MSGTALQRMMNPKSPMPGAASLPGLDVSGMKVRDALTLEIPFAKPYSPLVEVLPNYYFFIVPTGFDPKHPIGTGPFRYESFTPGVESAFARYHDYWQTGVPYVDSLQIVEFADEQSQVDALLSSSIDGAPLLSAESIAPIEQGGQKYQVSEGGGITPFTMRVDAPPFNDVRVRQAMRWLVDRRQMRELAFGGQGVIGNDVTSIWDPAYDQALPQREQDIGRAKSLLRAAGRTTWR